MKKISVRLVSHKKSVVTIFVVNVTMILTVFLFSRYLPPEVPLFFGKPSGASQLVSSSSLVIPPLLVIGLTAMCTGISQLLKDEFIDNMIVGILTVVTLLSTLAIVNIYHLVAVIPFL